MKHFKPSQTFVVLIVSLMSVSLLAACGARRQSPTTTQPIAPQSTTAPSATTASQAPATAVLQATSVSPTTEPTAAPPTAAPTAAPPTTEPTAALPTAAPTTAPQPDKSGDVLVLLIQKLEQANSAGDGLSDVPELK